MKRVAALVMLAACSSSPSTNDGGTDASASDASSDVASTDAGADVFDADLPGWHLIWSDEFNGANGSAPDPTIWTHDVGGDGWGNKELEYYTDGTENSVVQDGNLVITAQTTGASKYQCANDGAGGACQYTSARIVSLPSKTATGFSATYGRFEARMKVPLGKGLWPAFWLMGTNITSVNWPTCGEVDVMEILGSDTTTMYGSLHMDQTGGTGEWSTGQTYKLPSGTFNAGFHVFAVEWKQGQIDFFVDSTKYETVVSSQLPSNATWELDGHPFFILLNLAVGSKDSWPGAPDLSTNFPAQLLVDYVRVYAPAN
jgi:beta-glucanase (GH16 family)